MSLGLRKGSRRWSWWLEEGEVMFVLRIGGVGGGAAMASISHSTA